MRGSLWIDSARGPTGPAAGWVAVVILAGTLWGCDSGDGCGCGPLVDLVAPSAVTTLAITTGQPCEGFFTLTWTATGDDGTIGTAALYDLRYNQTGFVTAADWEQATALADLPAPRAATSAETLEVHGLTEGLTYHFALMVGDDAGNWSGRSNVVSAPLCAPDTIPPAAVTTLSVDPLAHSSTSLRLLWTAVGDDSLSGTAAAYDVRYNTTGIANEDDWAAATQVTGEPVPGAASTPESLTVAGLTSHTTYYFTLRVSDEAGLVSARSNVATGTPVAKRWRVDPGGGGDFKRIQPAIAAAADQDTIAVAAGVYSDTLRIEGKRLYLLGAGAEACLVNHPTQEERVLTVVDAPGVFLSGFAFTQQHTLCGNGVHIEASSVRFEACALYHCGITSEGSAIELRQCTIDGQCSMDCDLVVPAVELKGGGAQFETCILSIETGGNDQLLCTESPQVSFKCCDILMELIDCPDPFGGADGNFALDPMYRDAAAGDFRLLAGSPCLPEFSPSGCGLVGALGTAE